MAKTQRRPTSKETAEARSLERVTPYCDKPRAPDALSVSGTGNYNTQSARLAKHCNIRYLKEQPAVGEPSPLIEMLTNEVQTSPMTTAIQTGSR